MESVIKRYNITFVSIQYSMRELVCDVGYCE